jgi:hypothetical protein
VSASEIDARSALAKRLLRPYDTAFCLVLLSVDNRAGSHDVELDVSDARLLVGDGPLARAVGRPEVEAHLVDRAAEATLGRRGSVRVPPGDRFEGVVALFPPGTSLRDVRAIEVQIGGMRAAVPGKYFTLEEKRAIDASRKRALR